MIVYKILIFLEIMISRYVNKKFVQQYIHNPIIGESSIKMIPRKWARQVAQSRVSKESLWS